ncbi:MAG TPA: hypothetical protein VFV30_00885 [Novosphingobium sp.]|nr:hypothetical protein [Novosphingobium sp.]
MNRKLAAALAAIALIAPVALSAKAPAADRPDLDAQARCAALFALVARDQNFKVPGSERYPSMAEGGREFFIETGLRLLNERKMPEAELKPYFVALIDGIEKEHAAAPDPAARRASEMDGCLKMRERVLSSKRAN